MRYSIKKSIFRVTIGVWCGIQAACIAVSGYAYAQTAPPAQTSQMTVADANAERAQLEQELQNIEQQITQYEGELATTRTQKKTLQNKIAQLKKKREAIGLQITYTKLKLTDVSNKLTDTQNKIDVTVQKINEHRALLAELLRQIHSSDQISEIDMLVASSSLSDYFLSVEELDQVQASLREVLQGTRQLKQELDTHANELQGQKTETQDLLTVQSLQEQALVNAKKEQDQLLKETGGRETQYQKILSDTKKRAAEIRSRIYELVGVTKQINFGEAVKLAEWASGLTRVRPAFLLAIMKQESNLGRNVGTCNRPGDPPEKSWRAVMKPDRDQDIFLKITNELGLDPNTMPVSCPMTRGGKRVGWGGAMGPAQFIPSTWWNHKDEVKSVTGQAIANPWDTRDAFIASAILLKVNGADSETPDAEWRAAMRYFSGGTNTAYRFYGDNVMSLASGFQDDIDNLNAAK